MPDGAPSDGGICLGCGTTVVNVPDSGSCPACGDPILKRDTHRRLGLSALESEPAGSSASLPPEVEEAARTPENSFARKFILIRKIGGGGMGWVWKAWETPLARYVAIKFLKAPSGEDLLRFEREAKLAAALGHPNIVPVYEFGRSRGECYLVMKLIDGESLDTLRPEAADLLKLMIPVSMAVHHAHEAGVIHRDIKPQNIMVTRDGWPYVLDFGLAKQVEGSAEMSVSGVAMGTPPYMSPEQAAGQKDRIGRRSDVYGLGATLYTLVTGRPPFQADSPMEVLMKVLQDEVEPPRKLKPSVSPLLEAIILKALEKEPERRYLTAADLAEDLRRLSSGKTIVARPPRRRLLPRFVRQNPLVSGSLAVAGIAVAIALSILGAGQAPGTDPAEPARREWWDQFRSARTDFAQNAPKIRELMKRALEVLGPEPNDLAQWYHDQAGLGEDKLKALEEKGRAAWPERRDEARRLAQSARAMEKALEGLPGDFAVSGKLFRQQAARAEEITSFAGLITLRIHVYPFAAVRSMRAGDRWFIKDGKLEDPAVGTPLDADLSSPLVIQHLTINDYEVELVHPEIGARTVSLRKGEMLHEREYRLEGDMSSTSSLKLRQEP